MVFRATIKPLVWDSDFFAQSMAELDRINEPTSDPVTSLLLNRYQLVQAKIAMNDYPALTYLQQRHFQIAEGEIDLVVNLALVPNELLAIIEPAQYEDIATISALAAESFQVSRFRLPWFLLQDTARFYRTWAEKAILGTFDDICLIERCTNSRKIKGFITLRHNNQHEFRVGLAVVHPDYRGCQVGNHLILAAQRWAKMNGAQYLRIATQSSNIAALRLYQRGGAVIVSTSYWLYRSRITR